MGREAPRQATTCAGSPAALAIAAGSPAGTNKIQAVPRAGPRSSRGDAGDDLDGHV